jgi:putative transposase
VARPLRIQAAGLFYHVTARGNGRMVIYTDDHDRRVFLGQLARVAESRGLSCYAYCLMANHFHLVAATSGPNLPQAIKEINGPYAQWWNRRHGRVGHVFQGRFQAQVVQDDAYLLTVCRYVVLNPVRAGLVEKPERWPWSSYRATAGLATPPRFLRPEAVWRHFSQSDSHAGICRYREFVAAQKSESDKPPPQPVLGDTAFVERFKQWRQRASPEVTRRERELRTPLDDVFAGAVTKAARNLGIARAREQGYSMTAVARYLDVHPSTVSKILQSADRTAGARCEKS